jgi:hypothetical protein
MNAASVRTPKSIATQVLLGANCTLSTAMDALELQSILFGKIETFRAAGDDVVELARFGARAASDAAIDCREHAESGDIIGAVDCLTRALSGHRVARNLFLTILEFGNSNVAEAAQLGAQLSTSVLNDLGAISESSFSNEDSFSSNGAV